MSKVFIDSSVLIAASISVSGYARELIKEGLSNPEVISLYCSDYVLTEAKRNIEKKRPVAIHAFNLLRGSFDNIINPPELFIKEIASFIVLKDAPIVAAAAFIHADYLATFDRKDLIANGKSEEIKANTGVTSAEPAEIIRELHMLFPSKAA